MSLRSPFYFAAIGCLGLLGACGGDDDDFTIPSAGQLTAACPALAGKSIAGSAIGLPSGSATITSATFVPAAPESAASNVTTPATPDYCRVLGTIAPRRSGRAADQLPGQPAAPPGTARRCSTAAAASTARSSRGWRRCATRRPDDPLPVTRGYVDARHRLRTPGLEPSPASEPGAFALNDEMLANFAYASYKKVKDVGVEVMRDVLHAGACAGCTTSAARKAVAKA